MSNDEDLAVSAYRNWGFENINKELIEILNIWAKFLYSPLLEDKVRKCKKLTQQPTGKQQTRYIVN